MNCIFKLKNQIKHYAWGSPEWIPHLLSRDNKDNIPWAELWMGVHPGGPSEIEDKGERLFLSDLINRNPSLYLGTAVYKRFRTLPFLFKVLAAAKPLSIQVHPSLFQAREGWTRENERNISLKASNRNYKDTNHKPEILCALSPFKAMCGFRENAEIKKRLDAFSLSAPKLLKAAFERLSGTLENGSTDPEGYNPGLKAFLQVLFGFSSTELQGLTAHIQGQGMFLRDQHPEFAKEWGLISHLAELYPGDPGIIAPLYLNLLELHPGEAIYLPAGVLHAYIEGFGIELMANSDNVLRGGLSPKHVDVAELLKIVNFIPFNPAILKPQGVRYSVPCQEFSLVVMECQGPSLPFPETGPSIVIVTQGTLIVHYRNERRILNQGESAFIPARDGAEEIVFSGNYTLYAASVGDLS